MTPKEKDYWKDRYTKEHKQDMQRIRDDAAAREQRERGKQTTKGCFVATAAFGDYNAPEVVYLSTFRDESLSQSLLGRGFIRTYYAISPRFAAIIAKSDFLRAVVRKGVLQPTIFLLRQIRH